MSHNVSTTRSATNNRRRKPEGPLYRDVKPFVHAEEVLSLSAAPAWFTQTLKSIWQACGIKRRMDAQKAVQRFSEGFQNCRRLLQQLAAKGLTIIGVDCQPEGVVAFKVSVTYRNQPREVQVMASVWSFA